MFTGMIEAVGLIVDVRVTPGGRRLCVNMGALAAECAPGASICVSGVCLTAAAISGPIVEFDVITETLRRTTLGARRPGEVVNIERSLRVGDRLDGHFVQGHVDGIAEVVRRHASQREHLMWLLPEPHQQPCIIPKGSVCLDGVSLTIADLEGDLFSVALIPTTLQKTTLSSLKTGDRVNVESDMLARALVHHLSAITRGSGFSLQALREAGLA